MLDQVEFLNSPQNNFHSLSGQLIPVLTHLYCEVVNAFFPIYLIRISLATICACSLLPFHCTHASSLWSPPRKLKTATGSPISPSLHSKQDQFCQLLFMSHVLQQPDHLIKKSEWVWCLSCTGGTILHMWSQKNRVNSKHFPQTTTYPFANEVQCAVTTSSLQKLMNHVLLVAHKDTQDLCHKAVLQPLTSVCSSCRTSRFASLELYMRLLLGHSYSLLRFLWRTALYSNILMIMPCLVSPADLVSVHSILLSGWPMKMVKSTALAISPWGMP